MSENINICKEIMDESGGIFIDNDIVQKMKIKFLKVMKILVASL